MTDQPKIPLAEQAAYAHSELAFKHRMLPARVKAGTISQKEADRQLTVARAIRDTLNLFAEFEDVVRLAVRHALDARQAQAARDALETHPAVQAVQTAFPGAAITAVRPIYQHTGDAVNDEATA